MAVFPVIVGYGGANAAGRSSFEQSYRRMVLESLPQQQQAQTVAGLATMMRLVTWNGSDYTDHQGQRLSAGEVVAQYAGAVRDGTLIRRIAPAYYDVDATPWQRNVALAPRDGSLCFRTSARDLPHPLGPGWDINVDSDGVADVSVRGTQHWLLASTRPTPIKAAGQLPEGFDPGALYHSRFQPRGLQMAVFAATDALRSIGIPWAQICDAVRPDQVGTYASSGLGQLSEEGFGGMIRARQMGGRPTSKQIPMGLNSMPADFVNAYVLGSLGHTEAVTGACASFLYNLRAAVRDIHSGARRVAFVGGSEAPITPEVMEGFGNMGALATDEGLLRVDARDGSNPRRYSRPFGNNAGFVMGESAQYVVLMDDALAIELGADIYGAVTDVFIDADGIKKSISGPGPGNYLTVGKALAAARSILGEETVRTRSFMLAHGSSTPQNRVTESIIFDRLAEAFGISNWPICAVKAYVGHSLAPASGDQIVAALGAMAHRRIPGIKTIDAVAEDVHRQRLNFPLRDLEVENLDVAFINSKGFGGNNATGVVLSAQTAQSMLARRHRAVWDQYCRTRECTREQAADYQVKADRGELTPIYRFGEGVIEDNDVLISDRSISVPGYRQAVPLTPENPYGDMC